MLKVRFERDVAHFKNKKKTTVYFNRYRYGKDNTNLKSTRYKCHGDGCCASIILSNDKDTLLETGKTKHVHPTFSDCEVAIDINYQKK